MCSRTHHDTNCDARGGAFPVWSGVVVAVAATPSTAEVCIPVHADTRVPVLIHAVFKLQVFDTFRWKSLLFRVMSFDDDLWIDSPNDV